MKRQHFYELCTVTVTFFESGTTHQSSLFNEDLDGFYFGEDGKVIGFWGLGSYLGMSKDDWFNLEGDKPVTVSKSFYTICCSILNLSGVFSWVDEEFSNKGHEFFGDEGMVEMARVCVSRFNDADEDDHGNELEIAAIIAYSIEDDCWGFDDCDCGSFAVYQGFALLDYRKMDVMFGRDHFIDAGNMVQQNYTMADYLKETKYARYRLEAERDHVTPLPYGEWLKQQEQTDYTGFRFTRPITSESVRFFDDDARKAMERAFTAVVPSKPLNKLDETTKVFIERGWSIVPEESLNLTQRAELIEQGIHLIEPMWILNWLADGVYQLSDKTVTYGRLVLRVYELTPAAKALVKS